MAETLTNLTKEMAKEFVFASDDNVITLQHSDSESDDSANAIIKSKMTTQKTKTPAKPKNAPLGLGLKMSDDESDGAEVTLSRGGTETKKTKTTAENKKPKRFGTDFNDNKRLLMKYNKIKKVEDKYVASSPLKIKSNTTCIRLDKKVDAFNLTNYKLLITNKLGVERDDVKVVELHTPEFYARYFAKLSSPTAKVDFTSLEYLIVLSLCADSIEIDCDNIVITYLVSRLLNRFNLKAEGMFDYEHLTNNSLLESKQFIEFLSKNEEPVNDKEKLLLEIFKTQSFLAPTEFESFDGITKFLLKRKEFFFNELTRLIRTKYPLILEDTVFKRYVYNIDNMRQGCQIPLFEVENNESVISKTTLVTVNQKILEMIKKMSIKITKKHSTSWYSFLPMNAFYQNDPIALSFEKVVKAYAEKPDLSSKKNLSLSLHLNDISKHISKQGANYKINMNDERYLACLPPGVSQSKFLKLLSDKNINYLVEDGKIKINSDEKSVSTLIKISPDPENKYIYPPYVSPIIERFLLNKKDISSNDALIDYVIYNMRFFTKIFASHILKEGRLDKFVAKESNCEFYALSYISSNIGKCDIEFGIEIDSENESPVSHIRKALTDVIIDLSKTLKEEVVKEVVKEVKKEEVVKEPVKEVKKEEDTTPKEPVKEVKKKKAKKSEEVETDDSDNEKKPKQKKANNSDDSDDDQN